MRVRVRVLGLYYGEVEVMYDACCTTLRTVDADTALTDVPGCDTPCPAAVPDGVRLKNAFIALSSHGSHLRVDRLRMRRGRCPDVKQGRGRLARLILSGEQRRGKGRGRA